MTELEGKSTLQLRIVGPLDGDTSLPSGATAWITAGDDEPIVVSIPFRSSHDLATVEVSAGRIVVVLRCPAGRRGRREFVLAAGETKLIEFGTAPQERHIITSTNVPQSLSLPGIDGQKPRTLPVDPNKIGQEHIPFGERVGPPLSGHPEKFGGLGGGGFGLGRGGSGTTTRWGTSGNTTAVWMPEVESVIVVSQLQASSSKFVPYVVQKGVIPDKIDSYESSAVELALGMAGCFAFVVKPTAPHQDKVLFHRTAWTHEISRFVVKKRRDATAIPIDTEVFLADQRIMPLLSFLSSGDVLSARAMGTQFADAASGYLRSKFANHHLAAVGAYALYALRETAMYETWIRTLYEEFGDTSDGAILYAMHLMRARPGAISEWYEAARKALIEAAKRPIPILTAGVRLLVEGLERLSSSRRAAGDIEVREALRRAQWIQARARQDEIFTALWMDRGDLPKAFLPFDFHDISDKPTESRHG